MNITSRMLPEDYKLPYEFDLLFDIKTAGQLYHELKNRLNDSARVIEETMYQHKIPFPKWYKTPKTNNFPKIVWIDMQGRYLTYAPPPKEAHLYQKMERYVAECKN